MRDNPDNIIPALFLSQGYTNMTCGQLSPLMQRDRPYAGHVMMQPVWDYYEGLKKRLPGMVLIGPDGRIVAEDLRGEALMEKVKELIGAE